MCFKNGDGVTEFRQFIRASHSARTAANHSDLEPVRWSDCRIEFLMCECVFIDELFHRTDGYRLRARVEDARILAQAILRTYAAANLGYIAGGARQRGGFEEPPFGCEREPLGNSIRERAAVFHALRIRAIDAPTGLRARGGFVEQTVDLVEITDAFAGSAFRRSLARNVTPVVFHRPTRYAAFHLLE